MHTDTRITSSADRLVAAGARLRQSLERMNNDVAEHGRTENGWTRYGFKDGWGIVDVHERRDVQRGAWGVGSVLLFSTLFSGMGGVGYDAQAFEGAGRHYFRISMSSS